MKYLLTAVCVIFALVVLPARCLVDDEPSVVRAGGDVTWSFDKKTHTLSITGGVMYNYTENTQRWNLLKSSIVHIVIADGVTSIGNYAFTSCNSLSSVFIPSSVTYIGDFAFKGCSYLKNVLLPNVSVIGRFAFEGCNSLESIHIPSSVTTMADDLYAWHDGGFSDCRKLKSITVDPNNLFFSSKDGVLFDKNFKRLIQYPGGKEGNYTIPETVERIENFAFSGCKGLSYVTITPNVTTIGILAFYGSGLKSVTIHANLTQLGVGVFGNCDKLTSINVDQNNPNYKSLDGALFNKKVTELIQYPAGIINTTYNVPDTVTKVHSYAFSGCKSLTSISIPSSVDDIDDYCFVGCNKLLSINVDHGNTEYTSIDGILFTNNNTKLKVYPPGITNNTYIIPDTITTISPYAFSSGNYLTSVIIPENVTLIGEYAFDGCNNLWKLVYEGSLDNKITCGGDLSQDCDSLSFVYAPNGFNETTLCGLKTITSETKGQELHDKENPCFKLYYDGSDLVLRERDNITLWKTRNNKCSEYVCNNDSGTITSIDICQDKTFVEMDIEEKKVMINEVDVDELLNVISGMASIDETKIDIRIEMDSEGYVNRIFVFVSDKLDAQKVYDVIDDLQKNHSNPVFRNIKQCHIVEREIFISRTCHVDKKNIFSVTLILLLTFFVILF